MSSRNSFASNLTACLLAVGILGLAPLADDASAWPSIVKADASTANSKVIEVTYRGRRAYLPIVPYIAYDYPYYYSRGFYPTHIGPGYIYYGRPYSFYSRSYYRGPKSFRRQKARRY